MTFQSAITLIIGLLNSLVPIIMGLLLLVFIWGLASFLRSDGDTESQKNGKRIMTWGVLGVFIAVSVWGLVNLLFNTFFDPGDEQPVDVGDLIN